MTEMPSPQSLAHGSSRQLPFDRVVLVMQGGGALGAYQAGAFSALDEAGIPLDWVCGVSIGGINAALIAGNQAHERTAKLRSFWEAVTEPPIPIPPTLPSFGSETDQRRWVNRMRALTSMTYGAPDFFVPRRPPPVYNAAESPEDASYYDTSPLRATLERLVDFNLINDSGIRLTLGASNVQTGEPVYFDNREVVFSPAHVMASAALPPGFPAVEIDGQYYWDGGVVSNSPLQYVLSNGHHLLDDGGNIFESRRPRTLVFQIDLWDPAGEVPLDITSVNLRSLEIHSATRINMTLDDYRRKQRMRCALARLLANASDDLRRDPDVQLLVKETQVPSGTLVRLRYKTKKYEVGSKIFEFSRRSMVEHWQAGYEDTRATLSEPGVLEFPEDDYGPRVFDVRDGWLS